VLTVAELAAWAAFLSGISKRPEIRRDLR